MLKIRRFFKKFKIPHKLSKGYIYFFVVLLLLQTAYRASTSFIESTLNKEIKKISLKTNAKSSLDSLNAGLHSVEINGLKIVKSSISIKIKQLKVAISINPFSDSFLKPTHILIQKPHITLRKQEMDKRFKYLNYQNQPSSKQVSLKSSKWYSKDALIKIRNGQLTVNDHLENKIYEIKNINVQGQVKEQSLQFSLNKVEKNSHRIIGRSYGEIKILPKKKLEYIFKSKNLKSTQLWSIKGYLNFNDLKKVQLSLDSVNTPEYFHPYLEKYIINSENLAIRLESLIQPHKDSINISGDLQVSPITLHSPLLSKKTLDAFVPSLNYDGTWNKQEKKVTFKKIILTLNPTEASTQSNHSSMKAGISLEGNFKDANPTLGKWHGFIRIPKTSCNETLKSNPLNFMPEIKKFQLSGYYALDAEFRLNTEKPEDFIFKKIDSLFSCKIEQVPFLFSRKHLRSAFKVSIPYTDGSEGALFLNTKSPLFTPISQIPRHVINAFISSEDTAFWHHKGFDFSALELALRKNIREKRVVVGGSTITMQTVKNLFLTRKRTISRKVQEIFLSWYLEKTLTKAEILESYLNIIEFGPNIYGITHAASHYFNKKPSQLSLKQASFLASVLPSPIKRYKQICRHKITEEYSKIIDIKLGQMHSQGRLSFRQYLKARAQPIDFYQSEKQRYNCSQIATAPKRKSNKKI